MHRMTGLLLLLWAGATVSSALDLQKRIIGGWDCKKDEREYHVKLVNARNQYVCEGTLINEEWILTAAHCNIEVLKAVVHPFDGIPKDIADHEPFKDKDSSGKERTHDIMLLKLSEKVTNPPVNPPDCGNPLKVNDVVQLAGHTKEMIGRDGKTVCGETPNLQCVDARWISCDPYMECLRKLFPGSFAKHNYQAIFCAAKSGVDACDGDSGGGVVYKGMIYGVHISSGVHGCTKPMLNMNVCGYRLWINAITGLKY